MNKKQAENSTIFHKNVLELYEQIGQQYAPFKLEKVQLNPRFEHHQALSLNSAPLDLSLLQTTNNVVDVKYKRGIIVPHNYSESQIIQIYHNFGVPSMFVNFAACFTNKDEPNLGVYPAIFRETKYDENTTFQVIGFSGNLPIKNIPLMCEGILKLDGLVRMVQDLTLAGLVK